MTKPADTSPQAKKKRTRLPPSAREAMILSAAIDLFAERGFAAHTRELAHRVQISEPLIYRYFGTKDALIQRVFDEVIESRWDPDWVSMLRDRELPLRSRLLEFYRRYMAAIDDGIWIRIVMYASLDGQDMTRTYIERHIEMVMDVIDDEARRAEAFIDPIDRETMWQLQSALIYYLVRKHIHLSPVHPDTAVVVDLAVENFLRALPSGDT